MEAALNVVGRSLASEASFEDFLRSAISLYFDALQQNQRLPFFVLEELVSNPERRKYLRKNFVQKPSYAMIYMQFDARVKAEQQAGRLAKVDSFDIMMSIASLTVFTFISRTAGALSHSVCVRADRCSPPHPKPAVWSRTA